MEIEGVSSHPLDKCLIAFDAYDEKEIATGKIFDSNEFIEKYTYSGSDLGALTEGGNTTFKVWAPTAMKVVLNLFDNGFSGEAYKKYDMTLLPHGVWEISVPCTHGTYYTYSVTTDLGTEEAVDPYARALGLNGLRGMVVDLSLTNPTGFDEDKYVDTIESYSDAVIWETHVRDFSNKIDKCYYKGKYLAFTERGLVNSSGYPVGVDYLKELGITHVQLLPIFDYATVDESNPSSSYNWGYDPLNYNSPEGSYSTDPERGEVRIREVKEMVQSLHSLGIGVVMDVVYNHTYSLRSSLGKIVPYYYYRYNADGSPSNGSGCGNETASNRIMFRKFMIDSLLYWQKEYHIDGFRFDLMGIHDIETMKEVEKALHRVNPKCLIYGEGWSGGCCAYDYTLLATQANISRVRPSLGAAGSIAVFNDVMRDSLKGSVFSSSGKGYINGEAIRANAERVAFGVNGGKGLFAFWSVCDDMVVNYMSAHDNNTLWDKLLSSNPFASKEELIRMNKLGAAIIMVSNGMPFMLSGEEILRTKKGDDNSYKSSDEINNIDWNEIKKGSMEEEMFFWYRDLIKMRNKYSWLRKSDTLCTVWDNNSIFVTYRDNSEIIGIAIINPTDESFLGTLPEGEWRIVLDGEKFLNENEKAEICVSVPAKSVVVLKK